MGADLARKPAPRIAAKAASQLMKMRSIGFSRPQATSFSVNPKRRGQPVRWDQQRTVAGSPACARQGKTRMVRRLSRPARLAALAVLAAPIAACATGGAGKTAAPVSFEGASPAAVAAPPPANLAAATPRAGRTRYVYADGAAAAAQGAGVVAPGFRTPAAGPGERTSLARHQKVGAPYQVGGVWYLPAFEPDFDETGTASWYGSEFHGRPTSNGELFDMNALTAAHPTLPLPSILEVTNTATGRTITVRLNDRGPFVAGRMLDLSRRAAEELGFLQSGTAQVRVRYLGPAEPAAPAIPSVTLASARTPAAIAAVSAPLASSVTPVATGRFVQAGAFADAANAERVRERVASLGPARVTPATINGARMYRVLLGPWADESEAAAKAEEVSARGLPGARVLTSAAD